MFLPNAFSIVKFQSYISERNRHTLQRTERRLKNLLAGIQIRHGIGRRKTAR